MKIRNGFVSNSSSSSFIIAFKERTPTADEMLDMFGIVKGGAGDKFFRSFFDQIIEHIRDSEIFLDDTGYHSLKEANESGSRLESSIAKLFIDGWKVSDVQVDNMDLGIVDIFQDSPVVKVLNKEY